MVKRWLAPARNLTWFLLVILLPVTSLSIVSKIMGGAMVSPPSVVFVALMVAIWLIPAFFNGLSLPRQVKPLLAFIVAALFSAFIAFFNPLPVYRDNPPGMALLEAVITLGIGVCVYLVTTTWAADDERMRTTLRWINWSGLVMLAWSMAQVAVWRLQGSYPDWMYAIQERISITTLYNARTTGLAFEPSWLAHQLNMLYLPLWLAAVVQRSSAHGWRVLRYFQFEDFLLIGGIGVLWFSVSRVGLLAFLLAVAYLLVRVNFWLVGMIQRRLTPRPRVSPGFEKIARPLLTFEIQILLLVIYFCFFFGVAYTLSLVDFRLASLFNLTALREEGLLYYAHQLLFAERVVFWETGWNIFNNHPLLGVGLGNSGYYFQQALPGFGYNLTEVNMLLYRQMVLPNVKSLWSRLLAETGMVGFALFMSWLVGLFASASRLLKSASAEKRRIGLAGHLALMAFIIEGFSVDSFALPYYWITFGLLTAAAVGSSIYQSPKFAYNQSVPEKQSQRLEKQP